MKTMNTPTLRFKEFSGAWEVKKLGDLFHVKAGGDISQENVSQEKDDVFKYPVFSNSEKNQGLYGYANQTKIDVNAITVTGRGNLGIAIPRHEPFYPIVRLLTLIPKKEFNIHFGASCINQLDFFIESTGVPQLTAPQLSSFFIKFPTLPEQTKIANFLTAIDEKIAQLSQTAQLLTDYKKGVMQQIFSQQLRFKDDDGREFAEWEEKELKDFLVKHEEKTVESNQYPVLTSSRRGMFFQKDYFDGHDVASKDNTGYNVVPFGFFTFRHMSDDVTFTFNRNHLVDKGIVSTLYPVFTTKNINDNFLQIKLNYGEEFREYAIQQKQGGSRTYMYFSKLEKLKLWFPSLPEQTKIANFLTAIDDKLNHNQTQLDAMKQYKSGLLQQMFV
jgi:type I restriction enzyme S subunit